ncbi:MAG: SUMF1/EgtB/PvdO family nonheme iron enzyme, partial [Kiritimatiellae bacterium]|nr:SUMF1/EgtB/PvdO family nonheme iron enzyme [Kiritimatiellia bacterium]
GLVFTNWTAVGIDLADPSLREFQFTMPSSDVTLTANYEKAYAYLTIDGVSRQVAIGETVPVTAAASRGGLVFTNWTVVGIDLADPSLRELRFTMPSRDVTLTANYAKNYFYLTIDGVSRQVSAGEPIEVTAALSRGELEFIDWTAVGIDLPDPSLSTLKFAMPAQNVTLVTNYGSSQTYESSQTYRVTIVDARRHEQRLFTAGDSVTMTASSKDGLEFVNWTAVGIDLSAPSLPTVKFMMPAHDVTLIANYSALPYLVIDLSGGPKANSYPIRYSATPPDLTSDTCRTTELWLRHIPKGTFIMGSPNSEMGRGSEEKQHNVTLTQDYYIGVFECTQRQWELVMGTNPSYFSVPAYYATRPVECVSYSMLRGSSTTGGNGWPTYGHAVDAGTFFGKVQDKTSMAFDLPTETQWEYACRAGTATALNSGKNLTNKDTCPNMGEVGRYKSNSRKEPKGTSKVGSYKPNAWGLYDMHGNVDEWCLDWYADQYSDSAWQDPQGPPMGERRVSRGGNLSFVASFCRSASRAFFLPDKARPFTGFRVTCVCE